VGQAWGDALTDGLGLTFIFGIVVGERIQNKNLKGTKSDSDRFHRSKCAQRNLSKDDTMTKKIKQIIQNGNILNFGSIYRRITLYLLAILVQVTHKIEILICYLSPLGTLVEGGEQLVDGLSVHLDQGFTAWTRLVDL
jgi:hypothetical protein